MTATMIYYNTDTGTSIIPFGRLAAFIRIAATAFGDFAHDWMEETPRQPPVLTCPSWEHRLAGRTPRKVVTDCWGLQHALDPLPRPPLKIGEPRRTPSDVWKPQ